MLGFLLALCFVCFESSFALSFVQPCDSHHDRADIFFLFPPPVEYVNSNYTLQVRGAKGSGKGSGYLAYRKMDYQSELFVNFTRHKKHDDDVDQLDRHSTHTYRRWTVTNEFAIEAWAAWSNKDGDCCRTTIPMNFVHCTKWKETDSGWTSRCDFLYGIHMRLICKVKDNQPTSLVTILAHGMNGTMTSRMKFKDSSDDEPCDKVFKTPKKCHHRRNSLNDVISELTGDEEEHESAHNHVPPPAEAPRQTETPHQPNSHFRPHSRSHLHLGRFVTHHPHHVTPDTPTTTTRHTHFPVHMTPKSKPESESESLRDFILHPSEHWRELYRSLRDQIDRELQ